MLLKTINNKIHPYYLPKRLVFISQNFNLEGSQFYLFGFHIAKFLIMQNSYSSFFSLVSRFIRLAPGIEPSILYV